MRSALAREQIPPERLHLELVESALVGSGTSERHDLQELHELGLPLVIDDFGTGFSPLSYLRDLPVSAIKIDRSFVCGLGVRADCERITEALIALGHGMGLDVIAEGVETREQADWLEAHKCPHAQGYLYGRPAPAIAPSPRQPSPRQADPR